MKVIGYDPKKVQVLPEFRTRAGEPKKDKVRTILESMVRRHEAGKPPQLTPGLVRVVDGSEDAPILEGGEHRLLAILQFNELMKKAGDEEIQFYATVERDTEPEALESGIVNNAHNPLTIFDKAVGMQKLVDAGLTYEQVSKVFNCSVAHVGDTLAVGKLPKKVHSFIDSKQLTEEAAIMIARYSKDQEVQVSLAQAAISHRETLDQIKAKAEERAKAKSEKEAEKAPSAEGEEAAKDKPKKKGKQTTKGKATAEDVKAAAEATGVEKPKKKKASKKSEPATPRTKSYPAFFRFLEGAFEGDKDIPEPVKILSGRIEAWFDNELTDLQLKNAFLKCCRERFPQVKSA